MMKKTLRGWTFDQSSNVCLPGGNGFRGDNRRFRGGRNHQSVPNAHIRSEIKDHEQVRKERQKKADRISYMKSKSKGKKFGKNGKNGRVGTRGKGRSR